MRPHPSAYRRVLILADIEGSSGCRSYAASRFLTRQWALACLDMSRDVQAVVQALFDAGAAEVTVQDFHRTGYNLLPSMIDRRARVLQGYRPGPVPGLGDPGRAEAVLFLGMHAASGTQGFLPHTLTSRIRSLTVNAKPLAEVQLFAASLAPYGVRPVFFSGCPEACRQAAEAISGIHTFALNRRGNFQPLPWRRALAEAAAQSLQNGDVPPYRPEGPMEAVASMRGGHRIARRLARRWGYRCRGDHILLTGRDMRDLYGQLIRLCYLTPVSARIPAPALALANLRGRLGLLWVKRRLGRGI
jgi:D-amino peptidase